VEASALRTGDLLVVSVRGAADPADAGADAEGDRERERLRLLAAVSEAMAETLDVGESLARLLQLVVPRLCDWAVVSVLDEAGALAEWARAHRDPARLPDLDTYLALRRRGLRDEAVAVAAVTSGEPVHGDTVDPALVEGSLVGEEAHAAWRRLDVASYTVVPLRSRGQTFGTLSLLNTSTRPPHDEADIATAVAVARRAALALDNVRLYAGQLQVAETLQRSLLAASPAPPGLDLAVRHRAAAGHLQVGGDWYDAFAQPDGAALLVIGDVVGHNVHAAAAMGQVRSLLRGIAYDRQETPAQLLGRLDEVLAGLSLPTMATALVARLEPPAGVGERATRTLRWSSAGHLPPLVLRRDGTVEALRSTNGTLLGVGSTAARPDAAVALHAGETVLLYTDGLVEHGRPGLDEGLARLAAALRRVGSLPVGELCDALLAEIVGDRPEDDVAVLAARWRPEPPPA
jgi:serine phosphatase RsbU (regulator of sigma subunit)